MNILHLFDIHFGRNNPKYNIKNENFDKKENEMFEYTGFTTALDSKLHSKYNEQLVFYILKHIFPDSFSGFILDDKPDIQATDKSVGIEITEAVSPTVAQIDGEFAKLRFGKKLKSEQDKCKRIIERNGGKVDGYVLSYPVVDSKEEFDIFCNALKQKLKRLSSYREKGFQRVGLFIFFAQLPIPFNIEDSIKRFAEVQKMSEERYDFLFLGYYYSVIYYDLNTMSYKVYKIGEDQFQSMSLSARKTVEARE